MNVASLELCKELYELSGWGNEDDITTFYDASEFEDVNFRELLIMHNRNCPAYDLGYLLRKLPRRHSIGSTYDKPRWFAEVGAVTTVAETPEDAAAKLAIELFKQGILK